jgi:hypothetical protein
MRTFLILQKTPKKEASFFIAARGVWFLNSSAQRPDPIIESASNVGSLFKHNAALWKGCRTNLLAAF